MTHQIMNACQFIQYLDQIRGYHDTLKESLKKFQKFLKEFFFVENNHRMLSST